MDFYFGSLHLNVVSFLLQSGILFVIYWTTNKNYEKKHNSKIISFIHRTFFNIDSM